MKLSAEQKATLKRYAFSSLISFLAGFILTFVNFLNDVSWQSLTMSIIVGAIFAGFRGGLKGMAEIMLTWRK